MSAADHRNLRLKRDLKIEREQHDKTLEALKEASDRLLAAQRLLDALDAVFIRLAGLPPAEWLERNS
jgi:hypothetical protein